MEVEVLVLRKKDSKAMRFYDAYFTVSRYSDGTWKVVLRQRVRQIDGSFLYLETAVDSANTRAEARLAADRAKRDVGLRQVLSTNLNVRIRMYRRRSKLVNA